MRRFAPAQPDLFGPAQPDMFTPPPEESKTEPLEELAAMLDVLRGAERLPWPDAAAAMAEEHRVLGLARLAGPEGQRVAAAILEETERLFSTTERAAR